jgi:hypothetical protein
MGFLIQAAVLAKAQRRKGREEETNAMVGFNSQRPSLIGENLGTHRFQRAVSVRGAFESQWAASPRPRAGSDARPGVSRFMRRIQILDCVRLEFAQSSFSCAPQRRKADAGRENFHHRRDNTAILITMMASPIQWRLVAVGS